MPTAPPAPPARFHTERVEREDLVMFINACFACTGQAEFYGTSGGQAVSIEFLHENILGNYRRLYARTLAAGINHFNQARIAVNLLATGAETPAPDRREEGSLIAAALRELPPQRALRALRELRERRVNHRRARAVIRGYLAGRPDPAFDACAIADALCAAADGRRRWRRTPVATTTPRRGRAAASAPS
ncbi:uncharacterized protein SOCEGT47_077210 [Sorangium cellulosum]|uniref:Uncharacterized protein n=1 Tax=Sorangium cellulosum TaxID=56 RepID=A0A4P2QCM3_SORCE|nr:hypothetical protein [Sorangium cellulosum]AUX27141.1 uncharacterized protein SOCEGT47_077210 [Sorangium cellulosum]